MDATYGSSRGAVLQQNLESAHHPKIRVTVTRYKFAVGLDPIDGVHTLAGTWRKKQFFFFFLDDLDFKYHKAAGCNFWQPQGRRCTAKSGIGTPPKTKSAFEPLRNRRGPRPNRWSSHLGRNVQKEYISVFFLFEFVSKYHKTVGCTSWQPQGSRFTAKFGIGTPAEKKVSLTRYQVGVGRDPINGVLT